MKNKIPCDVIRDLLPTYIDQMTSETSNRLIEEHLADCEACNKTLAAMQGGLPFEEAVRARKEIDFLKMNKKRNRRIVLTSILGAFLAIFLILAVRVFLVGEANNSNWAALNVRVDGNKLLFDAVPIDSASAIAKLSYEEQDGVVCVGGRTVLVSPFHSGPMTGMYTASGEIREVRVGEKIIWAEGGAVSALASDLYAARNEYVGDMSANNRLTRALNMTAYLGSFTNELETSAEPYGWRILLSEDISGSDAEQKETYMDAFGKVLVGLIKNLDHVTFIYTAGGEEQTYTVTADEASRFLGEDIKNCYESVRTLDTLLKSTGLTL